MKSFSTFDTVVSLRVFDTTDSDRASDTIDSNRVSDTMDSIRASNIAVSFRVPAITQSIRASDSFPSDYLTVIVTRLENILIFDIHKNEKQSINLSLASRCNYEITQLILPSCILIIKVIIPVSDNQLNVWLIFVQCMSDNLWRGETLSGA